MSLLEDKVDSAVASHETAELAKQSAVDVSATAAESQPHADEPPSRTASASDGMEEIDTGAPVPGPSHSREGALRISACFAAQSCNKSCLAYAVDNLMHSSLQRAMPLMM